MTHSLRGGNFFKLKIQEKKFNARRTKSTRVYTGVSTRQKKCITSDADTLNRVLD